MKRTSVTTSLFSAALISFTWAASASPIIYEPFDYASGSDVIGQTDTYATGSPTWDRAGTANLTTVHQVVLPSLTGPVGFPSSIGNAAGMMNADNTEYARMSLGTQYGPNSTLYYSLLFNVPDLTGLTIPNSNLNANNDGIIAFNNASGAGTRPSLWAGELVIRLGSAENTFNLGIRASTTAAGTTYFSPDLSPNQTYLVVVRYTSGATAGTGGVNDLWINPNGSSFGAAENAVPSPDGSTAGHVNNTASNDHIDSLIIGAGIAAGATPNQTIIDEIRVGTTWADVTAMPVPEPTVATIAGLGLLALIRRFRARRSEAVRIHV